MDNEMALRQERILRKHRRRRIRMWVARVVYAMIVLMCVTLVALVVCGFIYLKDRLSPAGDTDAAPDSGQADIQPGIPDTADDPAPPVTHEPNIPDVPAQPDTLPETQPEAPQDADTENLYEFGTPLAESDRVEDTYFDTAVFLGDSRTEGLQLFSGLTHGDFYWHRGMSVFRADSEDHKYFDVDGEKLTLVGAVRAKKYEAVYLMLGINELGYPVSSYESEMEKLVDKLIEAQPEAVIYLQTMPPINDAKAKSSGLASYERCENVERFNDIIRRIAKDKRVVLLDTAAVYADSSGQLPAELTSDGVHFTAGGYARWADYLRTHTIDRQTYLESRENEE